MGVVTVEGEGAVLAVNFGRPIVTSGDSVAWLCESDRSSEITLGRTCYKLSSVKKNLNSSRRASLTYRVFSMILHTQTYQIHECVHGMFLEIIAILLWYANGAGKDASVFSLGQA